jgi:ABC-type multidrug transport system fused ATPase/permease subunit
VPNTNVNIRIRGTLLVFSYFLGGIILRLLAIVFHYTMFIICCLFNPLRQIADKFNEMQMGMIAANRVFDIIIEIEFKDGEIERNILMET